MGTSVMPDYYPDLPKLQSICIRALLQKQPAEDFVRDIYAALHYPIIVFDETIVLITYAFPRPFYFEDWEEIAANGSAPQDKIIDIQLDYQEKIYGNRGPTLIDWGNCADRPQTCCPIICNQVLYGYIGIDLGNTPYYKEVMEAEKMIADVLGRLFYFGLISQNSSFTDADAQTLLSSNDPQQSLLDAYRESRKPPYLFAVLYFVSAHEAELEYAKGFICKQFSGAVGYVQNEHTVFILFCNVSSRFDFAQIQEALNALASKQDFFYALSDYINDLRNLPAHRSQAMIALTAGTRMFPDQRAFLFPELYLSILYSQYIDENSETAACPGAVLALARYDEENASSYVHTLSVFLKCFMNLSSTARRLDIHANTLRNRLDKISEILGTDCRSPRYADQLRTGLSILQMIRQKDVPPADEQEV